MEYCEGGDLSIFIRNYKQLKEDICRSFLSQLAFALQYLRQHNIVHMDLKPSNLLLTSRRHPVLKLAGNANQLLPTHILKKSLFIIF
jgi:serine/threonine-protein kinase ULK/ATG1